MVQLVDLLLVCLEIYLLKEVYDSLMIIKGILTEDPIISVNPPGDSPDLPIGPVYRPADCTLPTDPLTINQSLLTPGENTQFGYDGWTYVPFWASPPGDDPSSWAIYGYFQDSNGQMQRCQYNFDGPDAEGHVFIFGSYNPPGRGGGNI